LESLGVSGLGEKTDTEMIDKMSISELETVISGLYEIGTDSLVWEKQLNTTLKQTNGLLA
jgi:hypothetical protein